MGAKSFHGLLSAVLTRPRDRLAVSAPAISKRLRRWPLAPLASAACVIHSAT
jgi:hypothetical protein